MFHRFQRYFYPNHFSHFIRPSTTCIDHQRSLDSLPTSRLYCLNPTRVEASQCLVVFHLNATHLNPKHESPTLQPLTSKSDFLNIFKIEVASSSKIPTFMNCWSIFVSHPSHRHILINSSTIFFCRLGIGIANAGWIYGAVTRRINTSIDVIHSKKWVHFLHFRGWQNMTFLKQTEAKKVPTWLPRSKKKTGRFGVLDSNDGRLYLLLPNQPKKLGETHTENKITFENRSTEPSIYSKVLASLCKAFVLGKSFCIGSNKKAAIFGPACNIRFCFQLFAHIALALINEQANDWEHPVELSFWKISGSSFVKKIHTWFLLSRHTWNLVLGAKFMEIYHKHRLPHQVRWFFDIFPLVFRAKCLVQATRICIQFNVSIRWSQAPEHACWMPSPQHWRTWTQGFSCKELLQKFRNQWQCNIHMGVSNNRGTLKWMVYNGKPD